MADITQGMKKEEYIQNLKETAEFLQQYMQNSISKLLEEEENLKRQIDDIRNTSIRQMPDKNSELEQKKMELWKVMKELEASKEGLGVYDKYLNIMEEGVKANLSSDEILKNEEKAGFSNESVLETYDNLLQYSVKEIPERLQRNPDKQAGSKDKENFMADTTQSFHQEELNLLAEAQRKVQEAEERILEYQKKIQELESKVKNQITQTSNDIREGVLFGTPTDKLLQESEANRYAIMHSISDLSAEVKAGFETMYRDVEELKRKADRSVFQHIGEDVLSSMSNIADGMKTALDNAYQSLKQTLDSIQEEAVKAFDNFRTGIVNFAKKEVEVLRDDMDSLKDLKESVTARMEAGKIITDAQQDKSLSVEEQRAARDKAKDFQEADVKGRMEKRENTEHKGLFSKMFSALANRQDKASLEAIEASREADKMMDNMKDKLHEVASSVKESTSKKITAVIIAVQESATVARGNISDAVRNMQQELYAKSYSVLNHLSENIQKKASEKGIDLKNIYAVEYSPDAKQQFTETDKGMAEADNHTFGSDSTSVIENIEKDNKEEDAVEHDT